MEIESRCEEDTFAAACECGRQAEPGDIVLLEGDLGAGKTVFAKGFARGLGIDDPVTSPTFTIIQEYHRGRIPLYHFDVYRISDAEEMYDLGYEGYFFGDGVCLIEWASRIAEILPEGCKRVRIEKDLARGFDFRLITIEQEMTE